MSHFGPRRRQHLSRQSSLGVLEALELRLLLSVNSVNTHPLVSGPREDHQRRLAVKTSCRALRFVNARQLFPRSHPPEIYPSIAMSGRSLKLPQAEPCLSRRMQRTPPKSTRCLLVVRELISCVLPSKTRVPFCHPIHFNSTSCRRSRRSV